jgi:hypothetical protein
MFATEGMGICAGIVHCCHYSDVCLLQTIDNMKIYPSSLKLILVGVTCSDFVWCLNREMFYFIKFIFNNGQSFGLTVI